MALTLCLCAPVAAQPDPTQPQDTPPEQGTVSPASQPIDPQKLDKALQQIESLQDQVKTLKDQQQQMRKREQELTQQVEALEAASSEAQEADETEKLFSIYGFFDFNFHKYWIPDDVLGGGVAPHDPEFIFGNLNTYLDFKPLRDWRMLSEVRFLLNPIADDESYEVAIAGMEYKREDVSTTDRLNFGESFDFGSIEIERAWLQWSRFEWLSVTAGLFLTPYGIWNIDHGSPTRISATAPPLYIFKLFPERQLGLKAHGSLLHEDLRFDYALTVSNGRGPGSTFRDSDWDKAVGARLAVSSVGAWRWKAGLSLYWGDYTDYKRVVEVYPYFDMHSEPTVKYRELALGGDLRLEAGPLELQWEILANWRNYDDDLREPVFLIELEHMIKPSPGMLKSLNLNEYAPDRGAWGTLVTLGYLLPLRWLHLRPYITATWMNPNDNSRYDNILCLISGLNWRISGAVVLKVEHMWAYWPNKVAPPQLMFGSEDIHHFTTQLAVAF
jgi:FtsZ-binding cell division protein ZapB